LLLLLDEPLSALDRGLRAETAAELVRLQKRLGTTFVHVTHDQVEALSMADRIGVMQAGRMAQVGTPREIFERPGSRFVAEFMGVGNLWDGVVNGDGTTMEVAGIGVLRLVEQVSPGPAVLGIRAERLRFGAIADMNQITGVVERTMYAGEMITYAIRGAAGTIIQICEPGHGAAAREGEVTLSFPPDAVMVFPG
jgi:ABC-type Fe3+/spermidine/putrescine transport system ATPase subunit